MLNRFGFAGDGSVSYASRFLDTDARKAALASGGASISGFATDPCRSLFQRVQSLFSPELTDNANVNLTRLGDEYIAMTETPIPVRFDPETLATLGHDEGQKQFGQITTAHPHHDRGAGRARQLRRPAGRQERVPDLRARAPRPKAARWRRCRCASRPTCTPSRSRRATRCCWRTRWSSTRCGSRSAARRSSTTTAGSPSWACASTPSTATTGALHRTWTADPFFVFHTINAFEDGEDIVIDLCAHEDASIIELLELEKLRAGVRPRRARRPAAAADAGGRQRRGEHARAGRRRPRAAADRLPLAQRPAPTASSTGPARATRRS